MDEKEYKIICAWCKKAYSTGAGKLDSDEPSHGICRECMKRFFPEGYAELLKRDKKKEVEDVARHVSDNPDVDILGEGWTEDGWSGDTESDLDSGWGNFGQAPTDIPHLCKFLSEQLYKALSGSPGAELALPPESNIESFINFRPGPGGIVFNVSHEWREMADMLAQMVGDVLAGGSFKFSDASETEFGTSYLFVDIVDDSI